MVSKLFSSATSPTDHEHLKGRKQVRVPSLRTLEQSGQALEMILFKEH